MREALRTRLTEMLDLSAPILSAPMAGVAGGALASAVSRAGGLGLVGGGYGDWDWLARELDIAGEVGVGVGFITWALARDPDLLSRALERQPRAIFLSFGDIRQFSPRVTRAGVPLIAQVQTVADAKIAVAEGAQIIAAQGTEAGGHGGARASMALIPAVTDVVGDIPVVAAGGVADGRGLAAALMLGAVGVLCGTAFYATRESLAHPKAKEAATRASGDHTVRGTAFDIVRGRDWPQQWKLRTLENGFYQKFEPRLEALNASIALERRSYLLAQEAGDTNTAAVIVGEAVDLVREIEPAAAVVTRIADQAARRLAGAYTGVNRCRNGCDPPKGSLPSARASLGAST